MHFDETWLASRLMWLIPVLLSLSVHEWAHAWVASRLGDDTARYQGRLTLNPLAHIDPVGTLLLPLLGVPFGWAKPVPIQPARFRPGVTMRTGVMLTAAAGPLSNVCLAGLCVVNLAVLLRFQPGLVGASSAVEVFLHRAILINVLLAFFNALPVPPLDGSRVVDGLLPDRLRPLWEGFSRFGIVVLVAILVVPQLLGYSLLSWPLAATQELLEWLVGLLGA
jgi:Zn-dependent protease